MPQVGFVSAPWSGRLVGCPLVSMVYWKAVPMCGRVKVYRSHQNTYQEVPYDTDRRTSKERG